MKICGIDPSLTSAGIAVLTDESIYAPVDVLALHAVGRPGKESDGWDERSDRIVAQTWRVLESIPRDVDLVVIEDLPSHVKLLPSFRDRCVLWGGIYSQLRARKTPVAVCNPAPREKWATGKVVRDLNTKQRKARVLEAVREQWPDRRIYNDDVADALTLAAIGALKLGWQLPFKIKPRHHEGLKVVAWPKEIASV